jgi:kynureninase
MAGWWGNDITTRFEMTENFRPSPGAQGYQHSTNPMFSSLPLLATLEVIEKAGGIRVLYEKSKRLTSALEDGLTKSKYFIGSLTIDGDSRPDQEGKVGFRILTPPLPERGAQLSVAFFGREGLMPLVFAELIKRGVVGDERWPTVIRLAPTALYSNFEDVGKCIRLMEESLDVVASVVDSARA